MKNTNVNNPEALFHDVSEQETSSISGGGLGNFQLPTLPGFEPQTFMPDGAFAKSIVSADALGTGGNAANTYTIALTKVSDQNGNHASSSFGLSSAIAG